MAAQARWTSTWRLGALGARGGLRLGLSLGAVLLGCAASRASVVEAPVDLTIAPLASLPPSPAAPPLADPGQCVLALTAGAIIKSLATCYLDEHITAGTGSLHYPCSGEGPAEAYFGPQTYRGKMTGGQLELEAKTELDWEDGCRWGTTATIRGNVVARGKPSLARIVWTYTDRVLSGSGCSGLCRASSYLDVTSAENPPGSRRPPAGELDGED